MIDQFTVHFMVNHTTGLATEENESESAYVKLSAIISDLNQCSSNYCVVVKVVNIPSFYDDKRLRARLQSIIENLSKRELEVFNLAVTGLSVKEIAKRLCISVDTVKTHRKKIVSKAGVAKIDEIRGWFSFVDIPHLT